jgi:hypothetical protein
MDDVLHVYTGQIEDRTRDIPRTFEDYWDKVRSDNNWYYSWQAKAFRTYSRAKIQFPNVEDEHLFRSIAFICWADEDDWISGVPKNLQT